MFRRLLDMWRRWKAAPLEIAKKTEETKQILDQVHDKIQNDKISDSQLNAVSVCLEAVTIKLKPMKGGSK